MAGEERGAGRHYGTVDRVESLGSGSGYGRGVYGRDFHGSDRGSRGYERRRGFGRHYGRDSWGSDGNHDRVGDGRELRGTNTSNARGIASHSRSRGSASTSYRATGSYTRGSYSNYMGEASNSSSNGSNSSNYRGIARNSGESVGHSRGNVDDYVDSKSKRVIETGEVNEDSLRMESFEYALPVEHWMQVLENVPPKDLCNVALTSRYMNGLATSPELWNRMVVSKGMVKMHGLAQFFKVNRFKKIKQIDFSLMDLSKMERMRLINDIPESPLQKVNFSGTDLHKVPAKTLSKAVAHLKMVNLEDTRLTTSQLIKSLEAILSSEFLQDVNLAWNDLHDKGKGPVDLLCRAVCRLQKVNLSGTSLNAGQCARLVEAILSSESLLDVTLRGNSLSGVSADLLAMAVSRLKRVDLTGTSLTAHQCTRILVASLSSSTLRDVSLACADLSKVSADLLASVVSLLHKVDLSWTKLTAEQSAKVVNAIISSNSLVEVSLSGIDLSQVPAHLLAKAVGSLKTVNLKWTKLTTYQSSIVVAIVSSNSLVAVTL